MGPLGIGRLLLAGLSLLLGLAVWVGLEIRLDVQDRVLETTCLITAHAQLRLPLIPGDAQSQKPRLPFHLGHDSVCPCLGMGFVV